MSTDPVNFMPDSGGLPYLHRPEGELALMHPWCNFGICSSRTIFSPLQMLNLASWLLQANQNAGFCNSRATVSNRVAKAVWLTDWSHSHCWGSGTMDAFTSVLNWLLSLAAVVHFPRVLPIQSLMSSVHRRLYRPLDLFPSILPYRMWVQGPLRPWPWD